MDEQCFQSCPKQFLPSLGVACIQEARQTLCQVASLFFGKLHHWEQGSCEGDVPLGTRVIRETLVFLCV